MERTRKKKNVFVRYFTPFGLRQVCDLVMLVGFILIIAGLCTSKGVLIAGFACYIVGSAISLVRCGMVLATKKNRRDPAFKSTIINICIMGVLFVLSLFGLIWSVI